MTTVVTITVYGGNSDILNGAMSLCEQYDKLFSRTVADSDVSRINSSTECEVSADTAKLISIGLNLSEQSDGAFDLTTLPLSELWNVNNSTTVPSHDSITSALLSVGYKNININENTVTTNNNARLDLGGIAKGFIADKVKEYLISNGVTKAIINLGGNILLIGGSNDEPFTVGIQKPFAKNGTSMLNLELSDKTAVTSGIYERYFEENGTIYHHIIDPSTGYPVQNEVASVTVICDSSAIADGLSTACLVLGTEKGMALAKAYGAETVFINRNGNFTLSDGLTVKSEDEIPVIILK